MVTALKSSSACRSKSRRIRSIASIFRLNARSSVTSCRWPRTTRDCSRKRFIDMRLAIVVSRFNEEVTSGLLAGARKYLAENDIQVREDDIIQAPGAFEIPLIAQSLAKTRLY